jgi:hypothetical protein
VFAMSSHGVTSHTPLYEIGGSLTGLLEDSSLLECYAVSNGCTDVSKDHGVFTFSVKQFNELF